MKKNLFKKIYCCLILSLMVLIVCACKDDNPTPNVTNNQEPTEEITATEPVEETKETNNNLENVKVVFHYQRNNNDYDDWAMWIWTPSEDGVRVFADGIDEFGAYYIVDLADSAAKYYHATTLNYIYHKSLPTNDWAEKDSWAEDRSIDLDPEFINENNELHLYSFEGKESVYLDPNKDSIVYFVKTAVLAKSGKKITVSTNQKASSYELFCDGNSVTSGEVTKKEFSFEFSNFNIQKEYTVAITFPDGKVKTKDVNVGNYFDSIAFTNNYTYDGNDLGVTINGNKTTFKLWAPISKKVSVQLFKYGHSTKYETAEHKGQDKPEKEYELKYEDKGVWSVTVDENLAGYYYTYTVTNGSKTTKDIVDPYAKAAGLNGMRGYIADFSKLNPDGWSYDYKRPYTPTELIVYELHVRDLTMDDTWTGTEKNRGKFLGLAEAGTTYKEGNITVTTGFDHIKELGVNAVQILPFYDQANDETSNTFNWGYNPQNYNVLEGQYSSNPYDAEARIKEFKEVVLAYQNAGIEIIMDVVYNHMSGISGSSFDKIVPGYFFRYTTNGAPSNGSGCGNETASDRPMYQKYMIESTEFWIKEYNLSGFRFDLMGLHDIETMNLIADNLHKIDENIVIYGEPWTGGTSTLPTSEQAITSNASSLNGVGIFNDRIRDGIKGSVFHAGAGAWVQSAGGCDSVAQSMNGLLFGDPKKQVNYVTCHDNNTLTDKLLLSGVAEEDLINANVLSQGIILTSEGISFIHAGEEILRSKPIYDSEGNFEGYSGNSYNLPDETNSLKWDEKIKYLEAFNKYKELIAINKEHKIFQLSTAEECKNYQTLCDSTNRYLIVSKITRPSSIANEENWSKVLIIYANKKAGTEIGSYNLTGQWKVGFVSGDTTLNVGDTVSNNVTFGNYTMIILYQ